MKSTSRLRPAFPLASAIAALLSAPSVQADQIWDGGSTGPGDGNWNTAENWGLDTLPTFTNAITFVGNTRNGAVNNLTADSIIGGINLTNDGTTGKTNAFTLSGNRITLGGNIITTASSSAITDAISLNMILDADRTITTNTNHNLTVSGIISQSGTRRLTKDGAGILTLANANSYSGGTTVTAGTLNVANVSGLGTTGSTVSLGSATTLRLSTDTAFGSGGNPVYNVQMTNSGPYTSTIELNRATAGAYAGITHNFGSLTISLNGGAAATLNVTAGANAAGALDTIAFTSMSAGNNNTVTETLNPTGGNITIGTLTAFGNQLVTMALSGTTAGNAITGLIGGTGNQQLVAISKIGASTWTLSNASNNYTGGTTFSAGTLVFASGALGTTGAITASGGTLRWASGNTQDISSRLAMTAATSTFDTNGNNVTFASAIGSSVAAALTKTGSGTLTLQGTNTYTGSTTLNAGTLTLDYGTNDTTKLSNTTALVLGGGTLNLAGGNHTEVVSGTTLTALTGSYVTRSSGTSVLQMNSITNNTGTVNFGAGNIATADNLNSATTGIIGTWATVGSDWAINSGSTTSGGATVAGVGVADGFIRAYTAYTDVTRLSSGTKAISNGTTTNVRIVDGTGSAGDNTVTGTIAINTLNQSATGGASTIAMANQTLRTDGILMGPSAGALTIGAAGGTAALSGTLTPTTSGGSIIVTNNSSNTLNKNNLKPEKGYKNNSSNTLTINSVIAENGSNSKLVKSGTGVLVLNGLSTYLGGTTLQDGTIRVGATVGTPGGASILGSSNNNGLIMADKSTAVFDVNGQTAYIKDLMGGGSLGGNVTLGSGTLVLSNVSNDSNRYNGTISGTGNLTVRGSSSWNTAGAHTYTGITTLHSALFITTILADGGVASGIGQSSSAASNLIIENGALSYRGTSAASTNRQFTLAGNGGLAVDDVGAITWSYTGAVTYSGAGTKTLNFSRNGSGLGTLAASIGNNSLDAVSINKTGSSNWALTNAGSAFTGAITFNATGNSGTLSYASAGGANPITFSQTSGTATLSYIGSGMTMTGPITASALSTGAITLDASGAGAVNYSNTGSLGNGGASGAKGLVLSGNNTGNNILAGQWVNNSAGGAATLTKTGAGTWRISGNNTHSGATAVNGGTLQISHANALGFGGNQTTATGATTVSSGFTLDLNGSNTIHEPITLSGTGIGGNGALINNSGTTAVIGNGIAGIQLPGATTGTGYSTVPTVSITGTGTGATATATLGLTAASIGITGGGTGWAVGNQLAITGGGGSGAVAQVTSVSSGAITGLSIVVPGTGYTSAPTGFTKISGGATTNPTFTFNATNFTVSGVAMTNAGSGYTGTPTYAFSAGNAVASTVALSSVVLAADSSIGGSGNTTINAVVSQSGGARALTKVGAGTLTLSAANTYIGNTNVNAGKLVINGSISTSVLTTVASGATIEGTGTTGALTVQSGGFINPGSSPGTLDVIGNYTQAGLYTADIQGLVAGDLAGNHDLITVAGAVNITGGSLTTLFSTFTPVNGNLIFILLNDGTDAITGTFSGLAQGDTVTTYGGFTWKISYNADSASNTFTGTPNGNDIALMAVPEPRAALLGGLSLLMLLRRRRAS